MLYGVQLGLPLKSFDISTAFLQGLRFHELKEKARALGYETSSEKKVYPTGEFLATFERDSDLRYHVTDNKAE